MEKLNNNLKPKVLAIVQARMGSTRLPGKVLKKINNKSLIEILLIRLSRSTLVDKIVVATTKNKDDDILAEKVMSLGFEIFRGSQNNVLDRYYKCAKKYLPNTIVRITGDCPLIDSQLVDDLVNYHYLNEADYTSNTIAPSFPDGLDIEVFSFSALEKSIQYASSSHDKEHVTPVLKTNHNFSKNNFSSEIDFSQMRWTVDEISDLTVIKNIINHFNPNLFFHWKEIIEFSKSDPKKFDANKDIIRDEGSIIGSGQKLWKRSKKIIPGGNMLLSKRSEMFLPEKWPSYFSKSKGYKVWDLDGNIFNDMCIMGIGTNILGYGRQEIDDAVKKTSFCWKYVNI